MKKKKRKPNENKHIDTKNQGSCVIRGECVEWGGWNGKGSTVWKQMETTFGGERVEVGDRS